MQLSPVTQHTHVCVRASVSERNSIVCAALCEPRHGQVTEVPHRQARHAASRCSRPHLSSRQPVLSPKSSRFNVTEMELHSIEHFKTGIFHSVRFPEGSSKLLRVYH